MKKHLLTSLCHLCYAHTFRMRHESKDWEDDESCVHTRTAIDQRDYQGISENSPKKEDYRS